MHYSQLVILRGMCFFVPRGAMYRACPLSSSATVPTRTRDGNGQGSTLVMYMKTDRRNAGLTGSSSLPSENTGPKRFSPVIVAIGDATFGDIPLSILNPSIKNRRVVGWISMNSQNIISNGGRLASSCSPRLCERQVGRIESHAHRSWR